MAVASISQCLATCPTFRQAAHCTSGLPFKTVRVEEAEERHTLTITAAWTPVQKGNKHPHIKIDEVNFAHETAFQWNSDSSEDEDGECDASDVGDECADHGGPCCGLECNARALPCTLAMFREMEHGFWWLNPTAPQDLEYRDKPSTLPDDEHHDAVPPTVCGEPSTLPDDEHLVAVPPPVCGSECESGVCDSMTRLASRSRGRFRRAESHKKLAEKVIE